MKTKTLIVLTAILLASVVAMAGNNGSIVLYDTVMVNGKQLPAGEYRVKWEGKGPSVDVTILKDGTKPVVTAKATLKELAKAPALDSVIFKGDGKDKTIAEIQFGRNKSSLVFE